MDGGAGGEPEHGRAGEASAAAIEGFGARLGGEADDGHVPAP